MKKSDIKQPFKFSKSDAINAIRREIDMLANGGKSFEYVYEKLKELGYHYTTQNKIVLPDNEDFIESGLFFEGKSYHWTTIECGNVRFIVRKYNTHFTIFGSYTKVTQMDDFNYKDHKYSAFEIYTDTDIEYELNEAGKSEFEDFYEDFFYCQPFYDFNLLINPIVDMINENHFHLIDNSSALKRPQRVRIKEYFNGNDESIYSLDKTIYAFEELSNIHIVLFAQNEMLEEIKKFKVGDVFGGSKIVEINTDLNDDNYHSVGIKTEKDSYLCDVYTLTDFYYEYVFYPDRNQTSTNDPVYQHYIDLTNKLIEETINKSDLSHVKEIIKHAPDSLNVMNLFMYINGIEKENK